MFSGSLKHTGHPFITFSQAIILVTQGLIKDFSYTYDSLCILQSPPTTTTEATTTAMMGGMPYNFDWGINDPDSGNQFSQNEVSDGNVVSKDSNTN